MSIIPDSHADILESMAMWHVATVGPRGEPQSSPVWIGWDGTRIMFSNLTTRQKYRNLVADQGQHVQPQIPGIDAGADRLQRRHTTMGGAPD